MFELSISKNGYKMYDLDIPVQERFFRKTK